MFFDIYFLSRVGEAGSHPRLGGTQVPGLCKRSYTFFSRRKQCRKPSHEYSVITATFIYLKTWAALGIEPSTPWSQEKVSSLLSATTQHQEFLRLINTLGGNSGCRREAENLSIFSFCNKNTSLLRVRQTFRKWVRIWTLSPHCVAGSLAGWPKVAEKWC